MNSLLCGRNAVINAKTAPKAFGVRTVLLLLTVLFFLPGMVAGADFRVTALSGEVTVRHREERARSVTRGDCLGAGDSVRTGRDSTLALEAERTGYMVYPYSLVSIGENPRLLWGKLSTAPDGRFLDIRFFLYPTPARGKTLKVGLRAGIDGLVVNACIRSDKGFRKEIVFFPIGGGDYRALTGFDIGLEPGRYLLDIHAEEGSSGTTIVYPFYLKEVHFGSGLVRIDGAKSGLFRPSEERQNQAMKLSQVLAGRSAEAMWEGKFIYPLSEPRVISRFGKRRIYYIDGKRSGARYHRGVDFRGAVGDPVFAPAAGVAVSCSGRITTGNTLVIDHGHGVFSLFFHLDSISVREGASVCRGETVACVGQTGITEGSHLHWSIVVDGVWVDPIDWIEKKY